MKDANEPTKIVDFSQRPNTPERLGDLLHSVRDISGQRLQKLLANMFEQVDDALFDLAEKGENNAAQMHYFDGMREVRKRRPMVERSFLGKLSREMAEMSSQRRAPPEDERPLLSGDIELSLVADNELEESLAITSMVSKNEARLARELFAVNQRLSVICGGLKLDDSKNPVGPSMLSQSFRHAMGEMTADMRVKLIIYKLFDRYVLSGLEELYREINNTLIRAGVLPVLRMGGRGPDAAATSARGTPGTGVSGGARGITTDAGLGAEEPDGGLLHTLHALFSARRGHADGGTAGSSFSTGGAHPTPSANELLGALSVLQSQFAGGGGQFATSGISDADAEGDMARQVVALRENLLNQIGSLRGHRPNQVSTIDEDTIDLVGMLFEFILEDRNLPAQMQVLLARLQIPYLKAAILDRKLFAHRQHPARRLLDDLAEVAKGWSEESDKDRRVLDKVRSIVTQLLNEFDDDISIFDRLLADLQEFQDLSRRRSELAEQRVAESTRGREKLEQARRRAAREILDRMDGQSLPPLIHGVLARAWANYLVLTLLRQGEDSSEFADGLRFVNEFIASTRLSADEPGRRTLRQMIPNIERALRQGLASVAFQENDIERLLDQLRAYYRVQLGESAPAEADVSAERAPAAIPESIQSLVDSAETAVADSQAHEQDELETLSPEVREKLGIVLELKPGSWLEFGRAGDTPERAKLSWISPMSGRYLFVNRRGLKVGDFAPPELAAMLAEDGARLLASNAFFDRAMDAIVGRLSQSATTPPEAG